MKWLGIEFDEGPESAGDCGPYRQSERSEVYEKMAMQLVEEGKAYKCFCSTEELERKKEEAIAAKKAPHYDGTCRKLSPEQVTQQEASGKQYVVRFTVPNKETVINDELRGEVKFPADMVGDFVIRRSNGMPVYNFCCVVDDALMKITHVIRGEDHLNNTLRQQLIYEALKFDLPTFIHCSLLIGHDRQKLSKRHGATSLQHYKDAGYLATAINNYLVLLGWSHPEEKDVFHIDEIIGHFNEVKRFSKSSAIYDVEKLTYINSEHLKKMDFESLRSICEMKIPDDHSYFSQDDTWKNSCVELFQKYLEFPSDLKKKVDSLFMTDYTLGDEEKEIQSWETTEKINAYIKEQLSSLTSTLSLIHI